mgnify:CR=1 FL=1
MNIYGNLPEDVKKQIIHQRRIRGFPLHEPPHWQNASGEFHITASCYKHQKIFETPESLDFLSSTYLKALSNSQINLIAWVFLPNHYHLLVELSQLRDLSEIIRIVHSKTATEMNKHHKNKGLQV